MLFASVRHAGTFIMAPSLQLYYVESVHLPGHPVTAAVLRTMVKEIHCTFLKSIYVLFWFACEELEHSGMFSAYRVTLTDCIPMCEHIIKKRETIFNLTQLYYHIKFAQS